MMVISAVIILALVEGLASPDNHGTRSQEEHYQRELWEFPGGSIKHALLLEKARNITTHADKTLPQIGGLAQNMPSKVYYDIPPGRGINNNDVEINMPEERSLNYMQHTHKQRNNVTEVPATQETVVGKSEDPEPPLDTKKPRRETEKTASGRFFDVKVFIDGRVARDRLQHFWRSTGLCPPSPHTGARPFLLSLDQKLNLALIGSLPHDAVHQVRIHWLLDLVQGSIENGIPRYNFSQLDALLDHMYHYQLRPGFELMGNPGGLFTDLENDTQVLWWRRLVAHTADRYIGRYGLQWVTSWLWETWNEPDHHDFDNLNFTIQGFLNYYDACRAGLTDVSARLVLGGPGGSCRDPGFSTLCWALLQHCQNGSSFFTPGKPPAIDFISFHKKGSGEADSILTQELETASTIRNKYPSLRHLPLINDEGDFLKGWWRRKTWRADSRYAALVARAVYIHHEARAALPQLNYSFDNAFLNYRPSFFDQRTMVARFQINSTSPRQVQLVKKPAYNIMALLALLGDRSLSYTLRGHNHGLSVMSSCRSCRPQTPDTTTDNSIPSVTPQKLISDEEFNGRWEATLLLSHSNGSESSETAALAVRVSLALPKLLQGEELWVMTYQLGLRHPGPYEAWLDFGRPVEPTRDQLAYMRSYEGPRRSGPRKVVAVKPNLSFWMKLSLPDVRVIHVCQAFTSTLGQVTTVRTVGVTSSDVLITWSDERLVTRCVLRYEVEQSAGDRSGPYTRLRSDHITHNNLWYSLPHLHAMKTEERVKESKLLE